MSRQVQLRRGSTAQNAAFTGLQAELVVDIDANKLILHDGTTQGGHKIATEAYVTSNPIVGPMGPQGPAGADGAQGLQGIQGPAGQAGADGAVGAAGANGLDGAAGPAGADGAQGLQGIQGPAGPAGADGVAGAAGTNGSSAYQVAVASGFVGTEVAWLATLVGPQGPAGADGIQGPAGTNGTNGVDGAQGPQGIQGPAGTNGTNGVDGAQGIQGPQGIQGLPGTTGDVVVTGAIMSTANANQNLEIIPNGNGEVHIMSNLGINNSNPGFSIHTGNVTEYEVTGDIGFSFNDGDVYNKTAHIGWAWDNGAGHGNNITGVQHAKFGIFKNGSPASPWISFDEATPTNALVFAANAQATFGGEVAVVNGLRFGDNSVQTTATLIGLAGADGVQGIQGPTGADGVQGLQGIQGPAGADGAAGTNGADGSSAYQVAVSGGFVGTEAAWLATLVGPQGPAGADGAVGPIGLTGPAGADGVQGIQGVSGNDGAPGTNGVDGKSAYQAAVDAGFIGTVDAWLASLQGSNGISAYQVAVASGFIGSEAQWLASLVGPQGPQGLIGETGPQGVPGNNGANGDIGPQGSTGADGKSAYQVAVDGGFVGNQAAWLLTLQGATGAAGTGWKAVPIASIGQAGDAAGDAAINANYLYYCTAAYDGTTAIWNRMALTGATW